MGLRALCGRLPRVNCRLSALPRYAVTLSHALRHGALQYGRRAGTQADSLPSFTGSAVIPFALIDIPFRMDGGPSGQSCQLNPPGLLPRTAGHVERRSMPHRAVPARRFHGGVVWRPLQFSSLTEYDTVKSSQCPPAHACPPWHFVQQETTTPVAVVPIWRHVMREQQQAAATDINMIVYSSRPGCCYPERRSMPHRAPVRWFQGGIVWLPPQFSSLTEFISAFYCIGGCSFCLIDISLPDGWRPVRPGAPSGSLRSVTQ